MIIENLNFQTISIFIIVFAIMTYFLYLFFKKKYKIYKSFNNKKYQNFFFLKYVFLYLSFIILLFSIFWINIERPIFKSGAKTNIVFVLDVSKSMNVSDINDSWNNLTRLDLAKSSIWNFVLNNPDNLYSLVIFSWEAVTSLPFSDDINLFLTFLDTVDYKNLNKQGTVFEEALKTAYDRFLFSNKKNWAIVLLSDWWDENYDFDSKLLEKIKNDDIKYLFAWFWSSSGWKIITWKDPFWRNIYQKYNWKDVEVSLNEDNLLYLKNYFSSDYIKISKEKDLLSLEKNLIKINQKIKNDDQTSKIDFSRYISFISFLFFFLYFLFYLFDKYFYSLINKNAKKT